MSIDWDSSNEDILREGERPGELQAEARALRTTDTTPGAVEQIAAEALRRGMFHVHQDIERGRKAEPWVLDIAAALARARDAEDAALHAVLDEAEAALEATTAEHEDECPGAPGGGCSVVNRARAALARIRAVKVTP